MGNKKEDQNQDIIDILLQILTIQADEKLTPNNLVYILSLFNILTILDLIKEDIDAPPESKPKEEPNYSALLIPLLKELMQNNKDGGSSPNISSLLPLLVSGLSSGKDLDNKVASLMPLLTSFSKGSSKEKQDNTDFK